ncbi:hypothetical protein ACVIHC_000520 [Bradyrhizobium diazoefficiens]
MSIEASCHCGETVFEVTEAPSSVTRCTCSLCAKRGSLWAYYKPGAVSSAVAAGKRHDLSLGQPHRQTPFLCELRLRHLFGVAGLVDRQA